MISNFYKVLVLILILAGLQAVSAQYVDRAGVEPSKTVEKAVNPAPPQYAERLVANEPENVATLYDNGNLATGTTTKSGVTAPNGFVWSEMQNDAANTLESNSVSGFGAQFGANRLADNFVVPAGQTWVVSSVSVYAFRINWASPHSPFNGASLRIWRGRPGTPDATLVYGDTTTNRLLSSTATNIYRIFNSQIPAPGNPPTTTRLIWENKLSVAPSIALEAGTYWIDFDLGNFDNNQGDQFVPTVTVLNQRGEAHFNARQFQVSNNAWFYALDGGQPASAPDVAQDVAFKINGTRAASNSAATFLDFNGDGKTDFTVTRYGPLPTSPSTWFVLPNTANPTHYQFDFGTRAGTHTLFSGVFTFDRVLPADYDGDGKTDIAVWRRGSTQSQPQAYFYILQSSNNQLRVEQFGNTGDTSNIFADYDGDGRADIALYRPGASAGAQGFFLIKKSSDGSVSTVPWGIQGDRPVAGDFDGDGKADFAVVRSTASGTANLYILFADGDFEARPLDPLFTYVVPGDFDGDGKTDLATIRSVLNQMTWTIYRSSDDVKENISLGIYSQDYPAPGDYNGDGKTDVAVYRRTGSFSTDPSFFIYRQPDGSTVETNWGGGADHAVAGILAAF